MPIEGARAALTPGGEAACRTVIFFFFIFGQRQPPCPIGEPRHIPSYGAATVRPARCRCLAMLSLFSVPPVAIYRKSDSVRVAETDTPIGLVICPEPKRMCRATYHDEINDKAMAQGPPMSLDAVIRSKSPSELALHARNRDELFVDRHPARRLPRARARPPPRPYERGDDCASRSTAPPPPGREPPTLAEATASRSQALPRTTNPAPAPTGCVATGSTRPAPSVHCSP